MSNAHKILTELLGCRLRLIRCDGEYTEEDSADPCSYWFRTIGHTPDQRRKSLRKQLFASLVNVLCNVARYHPQVIYGDQQGGLVSSLCSRPLVLEVACRTRVVTTDQMVSFRRTWSNMIGLIANRPTVMPQRSQMDEVLAAVPELAFGQPVGLLRSIFIDADEPPRYLHKAFAKELGIALGTMPTGREELLAKGKDYQLLLSIPLAVYFEDDPSAAGACAVCGKRGAFARCAACGMIAHISCLSVPLEPGAAQDCPRCSSLQVPDPPASADKVGLRAHSFRRDTLIAPAVGIERGLDPRRPVLWMKGPQTRRRGYKVSRMARSGTSTRRRAY